jgi:hypothetical protein
MSSNAIRKDDVTAIPESPCEIAEKSMKSMSVEITAITAVSE